MDENVNDLNNSNEVKKPSLSEKEIAQRRIFFVVLGLCLIIVAFIIWEIVDLSIGK